MAQKTLLPTSGCAWSWYICCSTKLSRRRNSFRIWIPYYALVFEVFENGGDFLDKQLSALWVPLTACLPTWTGSGGWHLPCTTPEGGRHSSLQKACDQCLYSWYCCKQTLPLVEAWPSDSIWSWQTLRGRLPWCYSAAWSDRLSEGGTRLRASV